MIGVIERGSVTNCYASGNVFGQSSVGGLIGHSFYSNILDCFATGVVSGSRDVGGLIGIFGAGNLFSWDAKINVIIKNCYATGNVFGKYDIGGPASIGGLIGSTSGMNSSVKITNCYATGNVSTDKGGKSIGGLIGHISVSGGIGVKILGAIIYCYSTGNVSVSGDYSSQIGGLVGSAERSSSITYCYATGNVVSNSATNGAMDVGGLVGEGKATNCYATGSVSGNKNVGGLVGNGGAAYSYAIGSISGSEAGGLIGKCGTVSERGKQGWHSIPDIKSSYYNSETSGRFDEDKGTPKLTSAMKKQSTYVGWDFANVWAIGTENNGYPYFRWQKAKPAK